MPAPIRRSILRFLRYVARGAILLGQANAYVLLPGGASLPSPTTSRVVSHDCRPKPFRGRQSAVERAARSAIARRRGGSAGAPARRPRGRR